MGIFHFSLKLHVFYSQNIQIEVPCNSTKANFKKCDKIPAIGRLYGCRSLLSLGTGLVIKG